MFQIFGHDKIWVIDGGFPRWRALGFNVESASKDVSLNINGPNDAVKRVYQGVGVSYLASLIMKFAVLVIYRCIDRLST